MLQHGAESRTAEEQRLLRSLKHMCHGVSKSYFELKATAYPRTQKKSVDLNLQRFEMV